MRGMKAESWKEGPKGFTRRRYIKRKGKGNDKFIDNCTNQNHIFSTVKRVMPSVKSSVNGTFRARKNHRVKKIQQTSNGGYMNKKLGVNVKKSQTILPDKKIIMSKFCQKSHRHMLKHIGHCRHSQKARGEYASNLTSGIAPDICSTLSVILSRESLQSLSSVGKKGTKKQVLNELFELGILHHQLNKIMNHFSSDALVKADHSIVVFPVLQSYFESLRSSVTPSLQERMTYEWLRLMSFSSYNGGGCSVRLARGGFFHIQGNETRCFCCNVSYSKWAYTDDVQAVHRRISPDCPFGAQGVDSNRNIPVENNNNGNQSQPPSTQQPVLTQSISSTETPDSSSSVTNSGYSFVPVPGITEIDQARTRGVPILSTSAESSSQCHFIQVADQAADEADISSQVVAGAQQPTEDPTVSLQIIQRHGASSSRPPPSGTESADILPIGTLKHPRYGSLNVRMSSFANWPSHLNQTPRQMAYAGFFHLGVADLARCFCCGGGFRNWEADDDPMVEHARWYPGCEYINKLKGTHFVQAVLRRRREHTAERQREQKRANDNSFTSPDHMTTEVAAILLEMGFTQERAREAILTVRRLRGRSSEVTAEEVTAWILDDVNAPQSEPTRAVDTAGTRDTVRSEERSEQRSASASSSSSGSNSEPTVTTQGATSGNTDSSAETAGGGDRKAAGEGATSSQGDIDTKSLKEENKLLKQMQVCKICMDKYVRVIFLPCGHLVCCEECTRSITKCPICRERIKGIVKTFMS